MTLAPVDLRAVIARAIDDVPRRSVLSSKGIPDGERRRFLLRQAFSNLIRNSLEACAMPGSPRDSCPRHLSATMRNWSSKTTGRASRPSPA